MMNRKRYLRAPKGCPFCHSTNIIVDNSEVYLQEVIVHLECDDCNKGWTMLYMPYDMFPDKEIT